MHKEIRSRKVTNININVKDFKIELTMHSYILTSCRPFVGKSIDFIRFYLKEFCQVIKIDFKEILKQV